MSSYNLSDTVVLLPNDAGMAKAANPDSDEEKMILAPVHNSNQQTAENKKVDLFLVRDLRVVRQRRVGGGSEAGQDCLVRWVLLLALLLVSAALTFVLLKNNNEEKDKEKEFVRLPQEITEILEDINEHQSTTEETQR